MTRVILAYSADERYYGRIRPYIDTIERHWPFESVLCCVDWDGPGVRVDSAALPYVPPLLHLQAGGFEPFIQGDADDVLIFTDGDVAMQRPPTPAERAYFERIPPQAVSLGFNAGPHDTLLDEYWRLSPKEPPQASSAAMFAALPVWNTGVVVARRATWRQWFAQTCAIWPIASQLFGHYARQQWAMCLSLAQLQLPVVHLPQSIHTHACYPLPYGSAWDGETLRYLGESVLFRHHLEAVHV